MAIIHLAREGQGFEVIPGLFYLTRVNNTGAAFGMLKGNAPVLAAISLICVILMSGWLLKDSFDRRPKAPSPPRRIKTYALSFIAAGAAGNLYDRISYGYVVDFLDFRIWPVFNIADTFICAGVFLMILSMFRASKGI